MKRKRIRIIAIILIGIMIINMFSGIPFVVKSAEAATGQMKDSRFQSTSYGVEDDRVIAHKLVLKDNESVIDLGIADLLLVKQVIDKTRIQLHIYGVKGLIHTYELDADNEWVKRWETEDDGYHDWQWYFATRLIGGVVTDQNSRYTRVESTQLYSVHNPSTNKYDIINVKSNQYYSFGADRLDDLLVSTYNVKNNSSDMKEKAGKICWVKYHIGNKCGIADATGKKITEAEYDTAKLNGKAVILTKEGTVDNGNVIGYEKIAITMYGKIIKLESKDSDSLAMDDVPYYLHWTDAGEYSYINIETGERTELGVYNGIGWSRGKSYVLAYQKRENYHERDSWTYVKWYVLTTSGKVINLNNKLGVDAIRCNDSLYEGEKDCLQVTGYRVLSRINGEAKTEYAFRGFIDGEGNVVFGYDTNETLEWEPYWWSGDYGILRKFTSTSDTRAYRVIDRQGRNLYQFTTDCFDAHNLQNEYLDLLQSDGVITLDVKSKKVLSNVKLEFDYEKYYQEYPWTTEEGSFIKVHDADRRMGIMNGKNQKIYWMAKDAEGKTDSTSHIYVYENDKEIGQKKQ